MPKFHDHPVVPRVNESLDQQVHADDEIAVADLVLLHQLLSTPMGRSHERCAHDLLADVVTKLRVAFSTIPVAPSCPS